MRIRRSDRVFWILGLVVVATVLYGLLGGDCSLTALLASPRVVGLQVVELDATRDAAGTCARAIVEMVVRALAQRGRRS